MLLALLPLAFAQADEAIIIEAERDVAVARAALDAALREQGYRAAGGDDMTRYFHPQLWRPRLRVSADGLVSVHSWRATPLMFVPGGTLMATEETPLTLADANQQPLLAPGVTGTAAGRRTQKRMESDLLVSLEAPLQEWHEAIWARDRLFREEDLRQEMHAIWDDGDRSFAERRGALVEMWLNTADNGDGQRVQEMIEVFLDEVVQTSDAPLTAAEVDAANARRPSERVLEPVSAE